MIEKKDSFYVLDKYVIISKETTNQAISLKLTNQQKILIKILMKMCKTINVKKMNRGYLTFQSNH